MARLVVVGAGISGLAAASFLSDDHDVVVLEAAPRAGGNVYSERIEGRVVDWAANGWLSGEPAMDALLLRAGLADLVLPASDVAKERWIFHAKELHRVPMSPPALFRSRLLPWAAKFRMLLEPLVGRAKGPETISGFVRRRLGPVFVDRMIAPMVAGVFAGDPDRLSLEAAFPRMHALENEHRSLILAAIRLKRGGAPRGHLTTLKGGAGTLTQRLAEQLGVRCDTPVRAVEKDGGKWQVHTDGEVLQADGVVLATPGFVQAAQVGGVDAEVAETLQSIPYAPIAVTMLAAPEANFARPPQGFGVLRARGATLNSLGILFTSRFFPDHVQDEQLMLRAMLGGAVDPARLELDDAQLMALVNEDLDRLFTLKEQPSWSRVIRHPRGIPQYTMGHRKRVQGVREAEKRLPGLFFTGNHLDGVAVKDCARAGLAVAHRVKEAQL